ncbi:MAG: ferredoxin-NADP reductase [Candidatus Woesearchaeota archaeon]|jgi:ferredoxin-NADP reductase
MFKPKAIKRFESKLLSIVDTTPTVREFVFEAPADFVFTAGQFVTIFFNKGEDKFRRQYSIASSPTESQIKLCVKRVETGPGTEYLFNLKAEDVVDMMAPLGVFVLKEQSQSKDIVFIATGTGIAPFRSMIIDLLSKEYSHNIILLSGVRYENEILYHEEFTLLAEKHKKFSYHPIVSQPKEVSFEGETGRVQKLISEHVSENSPSHFYLCGLYAMIHESAKLLTKMGVKREQVFFERYD